MSNFEYFQCDISKKDEVSNFFKKINNFSIFALINNAGIQGPIGAFEETDLSDWMCCQSKGMCCYLPDLLED